MESVQWGASERQRYSFKYGSGTGPWVVVIHGGAWRAPQVTDETGEHLLSCVEAAHPAKYAGFVSLDYRLSPDVVHPAHIEDVSAGLAHLRSRINIPHVVLVGHSCGAFLVGQLAEILGPAVDRIVGLEGIYALQELIDEYPDYTDFVRAAFPNELPRIDWPRLQAAVTVIHSRDDELLSFKQPNWLADHRPLDLIVIDGAPHDDVLEKVDLGRYF